MHEVSQQNRRAHCSAHLTISGGADKVEGAKQTIQEASHSVYGAAKVRLRSVENERQAAHFLKVRRTEDARKMALPLGVDWGGGEGVKGGGLMLNVEEDGGDAEAHELCPFGRG